MPENPLTFDGFKYRWPFSHYMHKPPCGRTGLAGVGPHLVDSLTPVYPNKWSYTDVKREWSSPCGRVTFSEGDVVLVKLTSEYICWCHSPPATKATWIDFHLDCYSWTVDGDLRHTFCCQECTGPLGPSDNKYRLFFP